jgi:hypothetical protein
MPGVGAGGMGRPLMPQVLGHEWGTRQLAMLLYFIPFHGSLSLIPVFASICLYN